MSEHGADVGLIGLAVMGQNLALNMADHGFKVVVYNRTTQTMQDFVAAHPAGSFGELGGSLEGYEELEDFVSAIRRPRRIVLMVKAGAGTDAVIKALMPLLDEGDIIVDGGNARWDDTARREREAHEEGIRFIGSGVSGGEEGARFGPSLMPGGDKEAWPMLEPIWNAIAAKVDAKTGKPIEGAAPGKPVQGGVPCTAYIGPGAAGHFVKMVHNGIEYADMQMICEAYDLMRHLAQLQPSECAEVFARWNKGDLDSFLIEITADILRQRDPSTGSPFVDVVLDAAGQKGTGKWTAVAALDMGVPAATIAEAVFARALSADRDGRETASKMLSGPNGYAIGVLDDRFFEDRERFIDAVGQALYCAKICSYAQGFALMAAASQEFGWDLDLGEIASLWRGGCIIRAKFLQKITDAYGKQRDLRNLLLDPYFTDVMQKHQEAWRNVIAAAAMAGVPAPAFASALTYFDGFRASRLPASLLQAQRDYFGAHTYERVDAPRGKHFHVTWPADERVEVEV
ncbi:MAG: NADP-dependent phosphogluconate dehydrogenase [Phycisphaerales bacterium]|nr:NADP-dependent phosphogluconate dehydrogenase [Phycisphaerales bacterium]